MQLPAGSGAYGGEKNAREKESFESWEKSRGLHLGQVGNRGLILVSVSLEGEKGVDAGEQKGGKRSNV